MTRYIIPPILAALSSTTGTKPFILRQTLDGSLETLISNHVLRRNSIADDSVVETIEKGMSLRIVNDTCELPAIILFLLSGRDAMGIAWLVLQPELSEGSFRKEDGDGIIGIVNLKAAMQRLFGRPGGGVK
jgi:hypothetical protein